MFKKFPHFTTACWLEMVKAEGVVTGTEHVTASQRKATT